MDNGIRWQLCGGGTKDFPTRNQDMIVISLPLKEQVETIAAAIAVITVVGKTASELVSWYTTVKSGRARAESEMEYAKNRISMLLVWLDAQEKIGGSEHLVKAKLSAAQELSQIKRELEACVFERRRQRRGNPINIKRDMLLVWPNEIGGMAPQVVFCLSGCLFLFSAVLAAQALVLLFNNKDAHGNSIVIVLRAIFSGMGALVFGMMTSVAQKHALRTLEGRKALLRLKLMLSGINTQLAMFRPEDKLDSMQQRINAEQENVNPYLLYIDPALVKNFFGHPEVASLLPLEVHDKLQLLASPANLTNGEASSLIEASLADVCQHLGKHL